MQKPDPSNWGRQTLLLYDALSQEEQRDSTLPERKAQIAVTLRRLECEYFEDYSANVLERRDRMRAAIAQAKASLSPRSEDSAN